MGLDPLNQFLPVKETTPPDLVTRDLLSAHQTVKARLAQAQEDGRIGGGQKAFFFFRLTIHRITDYHIISFTDYVKEKICPNLGILSIGHFQGAIIIVSS